jgi:hypothetical protein
MPEQRKIRSVLELARYKVGDVAWWVILRPAKPTPELADNDKWMEQPTVHPRVLYQWGPYRELWPSRTLLPKLQHLDFANIVGLLTSELRVEAFPVCDLLRSRDTGEFFYANDNGEWMPEIYLMDTRVAADREKTRILGLIGRWVDKLK